MKQLTLGSLFDGIGGFPLAAQRAGIKTIWASEIDAACIEITKRHFPRVQHLGDITQLHGGKIPPVDIISFGSPCQDLSTAGKQQGIDGERSVLFRDAIRIIYEMRAATNGKYPTFIIWENVKGAFGSNDGYDFRTVLQEITNARIPMPNSGRWANAGMVRGCRGGASVAWRLFDSQFWGVPQRRKRIFLVGDFRADRAPQILFECESLLGYVAKSAKEGKKIAGAFIGGIENESGSIGGNAVVDFGRTADRVYINANTARTITGTDGGGGSATGLYLLPEVKPLTLAYDEAQITSPINKSNPKIDAPCHTISSTNAGRTVLIQLEKSAVAFFEAYQHSGYRQAEVAAALTAGQHRGLRGDTPLIMECFTHSGHGGYVKGCGTLRASGGDYGGGTENLIVMLQKMAFYIRCALRKLTPLECERLQGFPDFWTLYNAAGGKIADTPRYMALGNSLTVPCAERVFRGIVAATEGRL
jgi:DNA (cytosine-5)-methyltransferase 1